MLATQAWTDPGSLGYTIVNGVPTGNVSGLLNTSSSPQIKTGGLNIATTSGNVGIGLSTTPNSKLDVNGNIQISNASLPMGLMTEVGGLTPLLDLSVNFREPNKNNTYRGAGLRIDTRNGSPLFQWISRPAGSGTETIGMSLTETGDLSVTGYVKGQTGLCIGSDCKTSWPSASITSYNNLPSGSAAGFCNFNGGPGNNTAAGCNSQVAPAICGMTSYYLYYCGCATGWTIHSISGTAYLTDGYGTGGSYICVKN